MLYEECDNMTRQDRITQVTTLSRLLTSTFGTST